MAYGRKRHAEFLDDFGQGWRIEIHEENFTGTSEEFRTGSDGFSLNWKGEGEGGLTPIRSSEVIFGFYSQDSDDDTFLRGLIDAQPGKYLVKIIKDYNALSGGDLWWHGMMEIEGMQFEDKYYPQIHELRAIDGINYLKVKDISGLTNVFNINGESVENFHVPPNGGTTYSGNIYNFISLIIRGLAIIPTEEFISVGGQFLWSQHNWEEQDTTAGQQCPFYKNAAQSNAFYRQNNDGTFQFKTVYDTIEQILKTFNARLFQYKGLWKIEQLSVPFYYGTTNQPHTIYDKNLTIIASGTSGTFITGDINDAGSVFRRQGFVSTFQRPINKMNTEVKKLPPHSPLSWSTALIQTLNGDNTPVAADYTNTHTAAITANSLYTFTLDSTVKITTNLAPTNFPSLASTDFIVWINHFIKLGDKYMYWDDATSKFKWTTNVRQVYDDFSTANYTWIQALGLTNVSLPFTLGWDTVAHMDEMPTVNEMEYYNFYRIMGYNWNTGTWSDETSQFSSGDFDVKTEQTGTATGFQGVLQYGTTNVRLYRDGVQVEKFLYTTTNDTSGAILEGGDVIDDEIMFANEADPFSASNIYTWNGADTFLNGGWIQGRIKWKQKNETTPVTGNVLPVCRQIDVIGIRHDNTEVITGNVLKTAEATTLNVLTMGEVLLYKTKKYICNGCTFEARSGTTSGEWQELMFDVASQTEEEILELILENIFETWHGTPNGWGFNF
jgi:hypothetical protein